MMCFGDNGSDTLHGEEQATLRSAAAKCLPTYVCTLRSNADAITWAVLEPSSLGPSMPRFTVARVAPAILVMVEDHAARRRFSSVCTVEEAVAFARLTVDEAVLALRNVHGAPEMAQ